ncbi:hypothetical protein Vafri_8655, partial [Volvox africanus]
MNTMEQQHGTGLSASKPRLLGLGACPAFGKPPFPQLKPGLAAPSPVFPGASPRPGSLTSTGRLGSTGSGALPLRSFSRHSLSPNWGCTPDTAATTAGLCDIASAAATSPGACSPSACILNVEGPVPGGVPSSNAKVDSRASADRQNVAWLGFPDAGGSGELTATWLQPQAQLQQRRRVSGSVTAFLPGPAVPAAASAVAATTPGAGRKEQKLPPVQIQWLPPVAPKPPTTQRNRPVKQVQWLLPEKELEKERQESQENRGKWIHTGMEDGRGGNEQPPSKKQRREVPLDVSPPARRLGRLLQPVPSPPPLPHNMTGLRAPQSPSRPRHYRSLAPAMGKGQEDATARAMAISPVPDLATLTATQWTTLERHLLGGCGIGSSAAAAAEAMAELNQALKMLSVYAFTAPAQPRQQRQQQQSAVGSGQGQKKQQSQGGLTEMVAVGGASNPDAAAAAAESASGAPLLDVKGVAREDGASAAGQGGALDLAPLTAAALRRRHGCYDPGPDDSAGSCSSEITPDPNAAKAERCSLNMPGARAPYSDLQTALRTHPGVVRGLWWLVGLAVGLDPAVYDCDGCSGGSSSSNPGLADSKDRSGDTDGAAAETRTQQWGEVAATAAEQRQQLAWGACAANVLRNLAVAELVSEQLLCGVGLETCAAALEVRTCCRTADAAGIDGLVASLLELLTALPHKLNLSSSLESHPPALGGGGGFSDSFPPAMGTAAAAATAAARAAAVEKLQEAGATSSSSSAQQHHPEPLSTRPTPLLLTPIRSPTPLPVCSGATAIAAEAVVTTHGSLPNSEEDGADLGTDAPSPPFAESVHSAASAAVTAVKATPMIGTAPKSPVPCTDTTRMAGFGAEARKGPLDALADLLRGQVIPEEVRNEAAEAGMAEADDIVLLRLLAAWRRSDAVAVATEVRKVRTGQHRTV